MCNGGIDAEETYLYSLGDTPPGDDRVREIFEGKAHPNQLIYASTAVHAKMREDALKAEQDSLVPEAVPETVPDLETASESESESEPEPEPGPEPEPEPEEPLVVF